MHHAHPKAVTLVLSGYPEIQASMSAILMQADEIRFIKGRLKFGDSKNSAPFPSAVVVFSALSGAAEEGEPLTQCPTNHTWFSHREGIGTSGPDHSHDRTWEVRHPWNTKFCPDCGTILSAPSGPLSDPDDENLGVHTEAFYEGECYLNEPTR